MTEGEQTMHEEFERELHEGMLEDARSEPATISLAIVVLTLATGERKVLTYYQEFGNDDGIGLAGEIVQKIRRARGLLQPGEKLERFLVENVPLDQLKLVPKPTRSHEPRIQELPREEP